MGYQSGRNRGDLRARQVIDSPDSLRIAKLLGLCQPSSSAARFDYLAGAGAEFIAAIRPKAAFAAVLVDSMGTTALARRGESDCPPSQP
jgi:hypothetical protein